MTVVLSIVVFLAVLAAVVIGLAQYWANTPHGRIKPIFALIFRLAPILNPAARDGAIGAGQMGSPEQNARVREQFKKGTAGLSKPVAFDGSIEDRRLGGAPGGELPVRIYRPSAAGPLPLIVYFHGGGFVVGDPDYTDAVTRILALRTPAVVVSVDYRLAPEHKLPAAVDDCEFAVGWCYENAESLGARPGPVAVAGDSAGGNLSAVVSQRDAVAGRGRIGLQALIYPCTDMTRLDRESQVAFATGYGLTAKDIVDCVAQYLPAGGDAATPDLSPLHAKSLEGLPRAHVITAGFDVLRDEGIAYAEAMKKAGVEVTLENDPAMPHGFITMTRLCSEAERHLETISAHVRAMG